MSYQFQSIRNFREKENWKEKDLILIRLYVTRANSHILQFSWYVKRLLLIVFCFFLMHKHCCFALSTYLKICRTLNKTAVIRSQRSMRRDYLRLSLASSRSRFQRWNRYRRPVPSMLVLELIWAKTIGHASGSFLVS